MTNQTDKPRIFTSFDKWMAHAVDERGMTSEAAYRSWRRAWWEAHTGRDWSNRSLGVKGKGSHYTDASTATEATAT